MADGLSALSPLSYWAFSELSGVNAANSQGGTRATLQNGAAFVAAGTRGRGVQLDGVNDLVSVAHAAAYAPNAGAISLWFNPTALGRAQGLVSKNSEGLDAGGGFSAVMQADGSIVFTLESATASFVISSAAVASVGAWNNLVISWGSAGMQVWLNGALAGSNIYAGGLGTSSGASGADDPLVFGANTQNAGDGSLVGAGNFFGGVLDEAVMFSRQPTASEMAAIYLNGSVQANAGPVAVSDTTGILENAVSSATGNVLTNDTDADGDTRVVFAVNGDTAKVGAAVTGAYGVIIFAADGSYTYAINASAANVQVLRVGQAVVDTFAYTVSDGRGGLSTASLAVTITGENDAPVVAGETRVIVEDPSSVNLTGNVLTNDRDVDGGTLAVVAVNGAVNAVGSAIVTAYGTMTIAANGAYTYVLANTSPAVQGLKAGEVVTETITYSVSDGQGGASLASVIVTITGKNDAPVVTFDTATVTPGVSPTATGNLLANDADVDGNTLSISTVKGAAANVGIDVAGIYGALRINADGSYGYTVNAAATAVVRLGAGQTLTDTIAYTVSDGTNAVASRISVTITGVNEGPAAVADVRTIVEDPASVSLTGNVLSNDSDLDTGTVLSIVQVNGQTANVGAALAGTYGALTIAANGAYSYTLANASTTVQGLKAGQVATEAFTYHISDNAGGVASTTLTISITGKNDAPVVAADVGAVTAVTGPSTSGNVLANDLDVDGDTLSVRAVKGLLTNVGADVTGTYGTLRLNADGSYIYTLNPASTALITLAPGATATETFAYQATDGTANTNSTLAFTVTGANDAPRVVNDARTITEDPSVATLTGSALTNDSDPDGGTLSVVAINGGGSNVGVAVAGTYGSLTLAANGAYTYALANGSPAVQALRAGQTVTDTFAYSATDGQGGVSTASVVISVTGRNDAPTVIGSTLASVVEDTTLTATGSVLTAARDVDVGDTLRVDRVGGQAANVGAPVAGAYGSIIIGSDGQYTYTLNNAAANVQALNAGQTVTETFTFRLADASGSVVSSTLVVSVGGTTENRPPVANTDNTTTSINTPVAIAVLANDTDPDGNPLRVGAIDGQAVTSGQTVTLSNGATATVNADGTITYGPSANTVGPASFTYQAADTAGALSANATVSVTIEDRLTLTTGSDTYAGGSGNGVVMGTSATLNPGDNLDGGAGNDTLVLLAGVDELRLDTLASFTNFEIVRFENSTPFTYPQLYLRDHTGPGPVIQGVGTGNHYYRLSIGTDTIIGSEGSDIFFATRLGALSGDDVLDGGAGTDWFELFGLSNQTIDLRTLQVTNMEGLYLQHDDSLFIADAATLAKFGEGFSVSNDATLQLLGTGFITTLGVDVYRGTLSVGFVDFAASRGAFLRNDSVVTTAASSLNLNSSSVGLDAADAGARFTTTNTTGTNFLVSTANTAAHVQGGFGADTITATSLTFTDEERAAIFARSIETIVDASGTYTANLPPSAANNTANTNEDTPVTINVLGNDTDADGDTLSITHIDGLSASVGAAITLTSGGTATLNANGTIAYAPAPNANGVRTFTYTVSDGRGGTASANVDVTIAPVATPAIIALGNTAPLTPIDANDVLVSSVVAQRETLSSVQALADGGYVVAWSGFGVGAGYGDTYLQRYSALGERVGAEIKVNITNSTYEWSPSVASLGDGGYVVAWQTEQGDGSGRGINAQRFAADGSRVGGEFRVNATTAGGQQLPVVTEMADGGFLALWQSDGQDGSGDGIYGQRFALDGTNTGAEFRINTTTAGSQSTPAVATFSDGGFVVAWASDGQDGSSAAIVAQRFNASGLAVGAEFIVNTTTADNQIIPDVTALSDGGFLVTWSSAGGQDGDSWGVFVQRYAASGAPVGSEFQVNTFTAGQQSGSSALGLADGGFVITWASRGQDGSGFGMFGRRFDSAGNPLGAEVQLNANAAGDQFNDMQSGGYAAGLTSNGTLVQVFTNTQSVFMRRFDTTMQQNGQEDQPFPLMVGVAPGEAGETVASVVLSGLPPGSQLSGGTPSDGGATWTFAGLPPANLSLTPPPNYNGQFLLTVTAITQDGAVTQTAMATRTVTVASVNDVPDAGNDTTNTDEDTPVIINVLGNDTDADGDTLSITHIDGQSASVGAAITLNSGGTATLNADGTIAYVPEANANGVRTFTYTVSDGQGGAATATATVNVAPVATAPVIGAGAEPLAPVQSADVPVSAQASGGESIASIANTANGFVVVWTGNSEFNTIYLQRFDSAATAVGAAVTVTTNGGRMPAVTELANGDLLVTWSPNLSSISAQRYSASGDPLGAAFQINSDSVGNHRSPSIAATPDGGYLIAWWAGNDRAYLARFGANDAPIVPRLQVNTTPVAESAVRVALLPDGGYLVTYATIGVSGYDIFAQRFDANGTFRDGEVRLNTTTSDNQFWPYAAGLGGGGYVVAWGSGGQDGSGYGVFAQRYDANGVKVGGEFQVNAYTNDHQAQPMVVALDDGGFVISWTSFGQDGSGRGLYAQRYDADGAPLGGETRLNATTALDQTIDTNSGGYHLVISPDGVLTQVFDSAGRIHVRQFEAGTPIAAVEGTPILLPVIVNPGEPGEVITSVVLAGLPAGSVLSGGVSNGDGTVWTFGGSPPANLTFTAPTGYTGTFAFTVTATAADGAASATSSTMKLVAVAPGNAAPTAASQVLDTAEDQERSGTLAATDPDAGDDLDYAIVAGTVVGGMVTLDAETGAFTFSPTANFAGLASFQFRANDGQADSASATVTINVAPVADPATLAFGSLAPLDASDTVVNTVTAGTQVYPAVSMLPDGGYVVLWSNLPGGLTDLFMQRFDASGAKVGGQTVVNVTFPGQSIHTYPSIATLADGTFIASWSLYTGSINNFEIWGRHLNPDGTPVGGGNGEFVISQPVSPDGQALGAVTALTDGGFVVTWESGSNALGVTIHAQRFDAAHAPVGGQLNVSQTAGVEDKYNQISDVAALQGGGFVVIWEVSDIPSSSDLATQDRDLFARIYGADGLPTGDEFLLTSDTTLDQNMVNVTGLPGGGFAVSWTVIFPAPIARAEVHVQAFNATGSVVGAEFVTPVIPERSQYFSNVHALADGSFVVTWTNSSSTAENARDGTEDMFGQRISAGGVPIDSPVRLNATLEGTQWVQTWGSDTSLAVNAAGMMVQAFYGLADGDIFLRRFDTSPFTGVEDTSIALPLAIVASVAGETLTQVVLSGLPANTVLSSGTPSLNGAVWTFTGAPPEMLRMTPPANYNGSFTLTVVATTQHGTDTETTTATRTVTVQTGNDAPDAASDFANTDEDTSAIINVLGNDTDTDGDDLTIAEIDGQEAVVDEPVTLASGGMATLNANGTITYAPAANANGAKTFTYTLSDQDGATDAATVTVNVAAFNDAPAFVGGSTSGQLIELPDGDPNELTGSRQFSGVIAFRDPDAGDTYTVSVVPRDVNYPYPFELVHLPPSGGNNLVSIRLTVPNADIDSFRQGQSLIEIFDVTITDASGATLVRTMTFPIVGRNDAPTLAQAIADQAASEDAPFQFVVPANTFADVDIGDTLALSATLADGGDLPEWLTFNSATRTFSGTPLNEDVGTLEVRVTGTDGSGGTMYDDFVITVANTNDAPVALADPIGTAEDTPVTFDPRANDSDPDGTTPAITHIAGLAVTAGGPPVTVGGGSARLNTDSTITYTPNSGVHGEWTFGYTISDGATSVSSSINIEVASTPFLTWTATDATTTGANEVRYLATFSRPTPGVSPASFVLTSAGVAGASIASVAAVPGSNSTQYAITVSTGTGDGSLSLSFGATGFNDVNSGLFAAGNLPIGLVAGDFNGDGRLDLAAAARNQAAVSVLIGNGNGTFQGPVFYNALGSAPYSVAAADVDGDGDVDLAVANRESFYVTVLRNNGSGVFGSPTTHGTAGVFTRFVAFGDFNGDGRPDMVGANEGSATLGVLLNDGSGGFLSPSALAVGAIPGSVYTADINGDGKTDIIAPNSGSGDVSILLGNGNGTFQAETRLVAQAGAVSLALGDLDDDGRQDMVTANSTAGTISVFLGNGDGTFQAQQAYAMGPSPFSVLVSDLNADGYLDVATVSNQGGGFAIRLGTSSGSLGAYQFIAGGGPLLAILAGDFNGDDSADLAITDGGANIVSIWTNPPYVPGLTYTIDKPSLPPLVIDIDGDGIDMVSGVAFDFDGDGVDEVGGWVTGDDAFLAFDRNDNGVIDDASEISFVSDYPGAASDLEGLRGFDTNGDGLFSAADAGFGRFSLWRDADSDGVSDAGELVSLSYAEIASISLSRSGVASNQAGGDILGYATVTLMDGTTREAADAMLHYAETMHDQRPDPLAGAELLEELEVTPPEAIGDRTPRLPKGFADAGLVDQDLFDFSALAVRPAPASIPCGVVLQLEQLLSDLPASGDFEEALDFSALGGDALQAVPSHRLPLGSVDAGETLDGWGGADGTLVPTDPMLMDDLAFLGQHDRPWPFEGASLLGSDLFGNT